MVGMCYACFVQQYGYSIYFKQLIIAHFKSINTWLGEMNLAASYFRNITRFLAFLKEYKFFVLLCLFV